MIVSWNSSSGQTLECSIIQISLVSDFIQILQPPAGYVPIRTPARKLTATPTPMAGTPMGFRMQTPDSKTQIVDLQPKGNLPMMKPDDMQYFDKLLVDVDEDTLAPEELKDRKIMKLLLKIKNGTPPMRKVSLSFVLA